MCSVGIVGRECGVSIRERKEVSRGQRIGHCFVKSSSLKSGGLQGVSGREELSWNRFSMLLGKCCCV